jgi:hypothetical protein
MSQSRHPKPGHGPSRLPADDLACNPGIGSSRGMTMAGGDPSEIEGDNTAEGDVANDVGLGGGINPDRGRTTR